VPTARPILVTGSHRSGTTWVGRTLAQAPGVSYIGEPFNPNHTWVPTTIRPKPFSRWFEHVTETNSRSYIGYMDTVLGSRYAIRKELAAVRTPYDLMRVGRCFGRHWLSRWRKTRVLMKDPIAFFATEWLAETYDMCVIVLLRHPAAFINSIKALDYHFDFTSLAEQDSLMARIPGPFRKRIDEHCTRAPTLLETGITQWLIFYHFFLEYQHRHPQWIFLRHEDLCRQPRKEFQRLFRHAELDFTPKIGRFIDDHTAGSNPVRTNDHRDIKRDSKGTLMKWRESLCEEEVAYIRELVEPFSRAHYSDDEW